MRLSIPYPRSLLRLDLVRAGIVASLMLTLLLDALDGTVVGTAMPRIIGTLHGFDRYTWTVTAYLLASTVAIPIAGKLSDQFGRKRFVLGGVVIFLLGSALCGAARSIDALIAFRALQGLGAGTGISLVFVVIADVFPPAERGKWQGVLGGVFGVSSVFGPSLGGWLAEHGPVLGALITPDARWRWVFYINLPLGLIALLGLATFLPAATQPAGDALPWYRRVDLPGAALCAAGTLCLLIGLTLAGQQRSSPFTPVVLICLTGAVLCLLLFLWAERHATEPLLPLGLFRNRTFSATAALSLLQYMTLFGLAFYVPLELQGVLGASPAISGLVMTPFSIAIVIGTTTGGMAMSRWTASRAIILSGVAIMGAGAAWCATLGADAPLPEVSAAVVLAGCGMGVLFPAITVTAQNTLPPQHLGAGSAAVRYLGQAGGIFGVAIVGAVVNAGLIATLAARVPAPVHTHLLRAGLWPSAGPQVLVSPSYRAALIRRAATHGPHEVRLMHTVLAALRGALQVGIQHGLTVVVLFCALALLVALAIHEPAQEIVR